jgi:O-acetyl-ADP-ribose deacetylase
MSLHKIEVLETDITTLKVDAIGNAANSTLPGGGGVNGAIHRVAGQVKITGAYRLHAKHVIHAVSSVSHGGGAHEAELLAHVTEVR